MKKTLDELTDSDRGLVISDVHWKGVLLDFQTRATPNSAYGLVAVNADGKLKKYAVHKDTKMEVGK